MVEDISDREMGAFSTSSWEEATVGRAILSRKTKRSPNPMRLDAYNDVQHCSTTFFLFYFYQKQVY